MSNAMSPHSSNDACSPHSNASSYRSASRHSEYSHYGRSRSPNSTRSRSRTHSGSRSRSGSAYTDSGSRSRSRSYRSRSWYGSRSFSGRYSSRSRSPTRSRSRSHSCGSRRSYLPRRTSSRSHFSERSRSRTHSSSPPASVSFGAGIGKDPRDRSKRITWKNSIWLIGEKAKDVSFHFCDVCDLPIVIYGRLLPCKHVLCYTCAMNSPTKCIRCQKAVQTIERCLVGGIFMCFESEKCHRTYLSQRDLQAHIDHRHKGGALATGTSDSVPVPFTSSEKQKPGEIDTGDLNSRGMPSTHGTAPTDSLTSSQHVKRSSGSSVLKDVTSSCPTIGFTSVNKASGLLPLPRLTAPGTTALSSVGTAGHSARPPSLTHFGQLLSFNTPPPPIGPRSIPPPSVMNASIPPPSVPLPTALNQPFSASNAVVALAAATGVSRTQPESLLSSHSGVPPTGALHGAR